MKRFYSQVLSLACCFIYSVGFASDWNPVSTYVGNVLDQTEMNGTAYLLSITAIHNDPVTGATSGADYSIHGFDGSSMTPIASFTCAVTNNLFEMNIQAFQDKLYIGGAFQALNEDTAMNYFTCYENGSFHQVGTGLKECTNGLVKDLELYNNTLLIAGAYRIVGAVYDAPYKCHFLTCYSGNLLTSLSTEEFSYWCYMTCVISDIMIDGTDLIVTGEFDRIGTLDVNAVARYSNGTWSAMTSSLNYFWSPGVVNNNGNLYTIRDEIPTNPSNSGVLCYLEKWNGNSWQSIKLITTGAVITDMISFNNQLFISGGISFSDPTLSDVCTVDPSTGDLTSSFDVSDASFLPNKFFLYNNHLYCTTSYGSCETSSLALYNQEEIATVTNPPSQKALTLVAFPNPAANVLYLKGNPEKTGSIEILDATGRMVKHLPEGYRENISLEELENGSYVLKIEQDGNYTYQNFIKNN